MRLYDVYSEACPTRLLLDHIADKWATLIIWKLSSGPLRFNELRRAIDGISQKVLSQALKRLERDGLLTRTAFATVPVTVEYALTPLGADLGRHMALVTNWAMDNIEDVLAAQAAYDGRGAEESQRTSPRITVL